MDGRHFVRLKCLDVRHHSRTGTGPAAGGAADAMLVIEERGSVAEKEGAENDSAFLLHLAHPLSVDVTPSLTHLRAYTARTPATRTHR